MSKKLKTHLVREHSRAEVGIGAENAHEREETRCPLRTRALANVSWCRATLAAILVLAAFLNLYNLTRNGYGNVYYAATVKNMLTSWHNFFFASFDAGFVSVDKPPLGFWIQAASTKLLGFHGWSLLLPQALAGILSVGLVYHLVRRSFGSVAGLLAGLTLALTPITVATNRNNNLESLLVLAVLLAAWAFVLAVETGRVRWLLLGALVLGLGFNIKMLEALLVLPAFYVLYLVAASVGRWRRMIHLALATVVLLAVSLSWAVAVDLTPTDQRPYVGSSYNNTATDLIFGWNGLERLTGSDADVGDLGLLRLLNRDLGGQIGWLLPLGIIGLAAASWQRRPRPSLGRQHQGLVLWGIWFVPQMVFFSVAGDWDPHYLLMLAPAIAALVGIGVVALWNDYQSPGWRGWLLPLTLAGTAAVQIHILVAYPDWSGWLTPALVILCLAAVTGLMVARLIPRLKVRSYPRAAISVGVLSLFIAPSILAASALWYGTETRTPVAGPSPQIESSEADPLLMEYLRVNQDDTKYLVAATTGTMANPIILNTDEPVISLGGFSGRDPVFRTQRLAGLVEKGAVRFFLMDNDHHEKKEVRWIQDNCERVPQELWQSWSFEQAPLLYDCSTRAR